ncbi:MAG: AIR synthase-related protein, partial [Dehalococcoidia bacterium]
RCYLDALKPVLSNVRGFAHITGGGLPGNVPRILPDGLAARIDRRKWEIPALFKLIQERGNVIDDEMFGTFNMGVGAVLAVAPDDVPDFCQKLPEAFTIGEVVVGNRFGWTQ